MGTIIYDIMIGLLVIGILILIITMSQNGTSQIKEGGSIVAKTEDQGYDYFTYENLNQNKVNSSVQMEDCVGAELISRLRYYEQDSKKIRFIAVNLGAEIIEVDFEGLTSEDKKKKLEEIIDKIKAVQVNGVNGIERKFMFEISVYSNGEEEHYYTLN